MAQVDEAEVSQQKRGVLRFQIGQAYQRIYGLDNPPPCSAVCVSDWWMLRLREQWASAFWESGRLPVLLYQVSELAPELEAIAREVEKGRSLGPTRRAVHGTWKLLEVAPQGRAKAAAAWRSEAEKTFRLARAAKEKVPGITRRQLLRVLMIAICGEDSVKHNGLDREARDPVYRAAYDEVRRSLKHGFKLAGSPAEFRHLI